MGTQQLMLNGDCLNYPEVVGSNPTPATKDNEAHLKHGGLFLYN